jgi:hypothetical protein
MMTRTHELDGLNRLRPAELSARPNTEHVRLREAAFKARNQYMVKHYQINEGVDIGKTRCERQK